MFSEDVSPTHVTVELLLTLHMTLRNKKSPLFSLPGSLLPTQDTLTLTLEKRKIVHITVDIFGIVGIYSSGKKLNKKHEKDRWRLL